MAKRKSSDGEGLNLDSLMDALTNVVAVLILVLLLVNADATNTIVQYFADLEPATPEQVQQSKERVAKLLQQKKETEAMFQQKPPSPEEIEALRQRIIKIDIDIKLKEEETKSIQELKQELRISEEQRDKEKEIVVAIQKEIETIKAQLDNTKVEEPKDNILQDIKIPEVKNIPDNADIYYIYVRGNKLTFVDAKGIEEEITKEWLANKRSSVINKKKIKVTTGKRETEKTVDVHDLEKTKAFLEELSKKLKSNLFNIQVQVHLASHVNLPAIHLHPTQQSGIDLTALDAPQNLFLDALRKISSNRNAVVFFRLDDNPRYAKESFLTYQKAREYVESKFPRMPIGWGIIIHDSAMQRWENSVTFRLSREFFLVEPTGTPPPRPSPRPSLGPTPPPMKQKLG